MHKIPHPTHGLESVSCAVLTVSDSRTPETDKSGQYLISTLENAGHLIQAYHILADEPYLIQAKLDSLIVVEGVQAIVITGGTGISPRDQTYEAVSSLFEKELLGFGEIFRQLSYQDIGSRAIASRATAGVYQSSLIFSLPGSTAAVELALTQLILPELLHLTKLLSGRAIKT